MAEVIVSPSAKETIITLGDGTVVSATISQDKLSVVSEKSDPIVLDLNQGARGQPGSAILVGTGYPLMSQGAIGDIFLSTGGVNVGAVFKKTELAWVEEGNVRGPAGGIESVNGDFGPGVILEKDNIGLGQVDNTLDIDKPVSIAQAAAIALKANAADTVNLTGAQTIADVKTFSSAPVVPDGSFAISKTTGLQAALTAAGDNSTLVALAGAQTITGVKTFSVAPVVPDASFAIIKVTGLQSALDLKAPLASPTFTGTVSGVTKAHVGLGSVDNTADTAKPVSTAQQTALNLKANIASPTFTGTVAGITATMVGLGNVVNLAQVDLVNAQTIAGIKTFSASPIVPTPTTATQVANKGYVDTTVNAVIAAAPGALDTLDELAAALGDDPNFATTVTNSIALKAPLASPTFTGTVSGITKAMVGLGNVDNTSDAAAPVSTAQQTALNLKADITTIVNLTTAQTIAGVKTFSSAPVVPDASFAIAKTSGLQAALDLKAPLASPTFTGTVTGTFSGNGAAITSLTAANLTGTILQARLVQNVIRIEHGSTAGTARPTGSTYVEWVGSVSPTNIAAGDTWINTSTSGNTADNYPSGAVMHSASAKSAAATGWYWMEGQQILISGDTALYNELTNNATVFPYGANTNGAGAAGTTHFRLPNSLGKHIVHIDGTTEFASLGATGGAKSVALSVANLPAHNHTVSDPGHTHDFYNNTQTWTWNANYSETEDIWIMSGDASAGQANSNQLVTNSSACTLTLGSFTGITTLNTGSGTAHNNLSPYLGLRSMIKR